MKARKLGLWLIAGIILGVLAVEVYVLFNSWARPHSRAVDLAAVAAHTGINFPKSARLDGAIYDSTNATGEYILHARVTMAKDDLPWFMQQGFSRWEKGSPHQFTENYSFDSHWADTKAKSAASWWQPESLEHRVGANISYGKEKSMEVLIEQSEGETFTVYIEDRHF